MIYYPAMAVNLTLRFDEALFKGNTPSPAQSGQTDLLADIGDGAGLDGSAALANRDVVSQRTAGGPGAPTGRVGLLDGADGNLSHVLAVIPTQGSFELPSFRQASKFSLNFSFRDFPVDPRALRSVGVEIYLGTIAAPDFARGMLGEKTRGGRLASQLVLSPANLMLAGTADSVDSGHSGKTSEVVIEGRGLQGIFLDAKVLPAALRKLRSDQPINEFVSQLLGLDPLGKKVPVRINPDEWDTGVPKTLPPEILTRINASASGEDSRMNMKGDPSTQGGISVWDIVTNACFLVGAVPYFIGHELWIRPSRGIFQQRNAAIVGGTPFKGGRARTIQTAAGPVDISYRKMVYGRNLTEVRLTRKFGGVKVPTVKCVSVDTSSAQRGASRLVEAEWPEASETAARTGTVSPSGDASRTDVLTIPIQGIKDKTRLAVIARQIYEEVGRGELGGKASSSALASLGGDNDDADLLHLRPGDAMELLVDAGGLTSFPPVVSELNAQSAQSPAEAINALTERLGGNRKLAEVLVGTARGSFTPLQNVFRVDTSRYTWDISRGIAVDFDFRNYVTVRSDIAGGDVGDFGAVASPKSSISANVGGAA